MMQVLTNAMVLQYVSVLNQHIVHLRLHNIMCQLYFNKAGKNLNNKIFF